MERAVTLVQLRVFVAVADHGSFSEAALALDLTQSSVSYALGELERLAGGRLFERGRFGARLTTLGSRLLPHARAALDALSDFGQEAAFAGGESGGTVRVATLRSAGTHLLPAIIADLRLHAPGLRVQVLHESRDPGLEEALHEGRADVSLLDLPVRGSVMTWPLVRDEYRVVYPRGRAPRRASWDDLVGADLLLCDEDCARNVRPHVERHGVRFDPTNHVTEDSVLLSMVGHGLGVSIMPDLAIAPQPDNVETRALPVPLWRTLAVAALPRRASAPAVRAFVESARRVWPFVAPPEAEAQAVR